jgi:type II secretory pathway pseudopilin PulG
MTALATGRDDSDCRLATARGYSLLELVFAAGLSVTLAAFAAPQLSTGLDEYRTAAAARYVAARLQRARLEALMRSRSVALRFTAAGRSYTFAEYVDGNDNGVLARDIAAGVDARIGDLERLADQFSGVDFGAGPGLPPIDAGGTPPDGDPIRLGAANTATFSPMGTSSSGTIYVIGRGGAQYAVRLFGATGKTRMLAFDRVTRRWKPQ